MPALVAVRFNADLKRDPFEPIEQVLPELKSLRRTRATCTVAALWHPIGQALDAFSPIECANDLAHAACVPSHRILL